MLLCDDPNCPGRHICKWCHHKTNMDYTHASNDTARCVRMTQTYRLTLIKAGKGTAPDGFYNHQQTDGFWNIVPNDPQPLPSNTGSTHTQAPPSFSSQTQAPPSFSTQTQAPPSFSSQAQAPPSFSTQAQAASNLSGSMASSSGSTQPLTDVHTKLAESERARHHLSLEVLRLETELKSCKMENDVLRGRNVKLIQEVERVKAKGKSSAPYSRIRENPGLDDRTINQRSVNQQPFSSNDPFQVNPAGDIHRESSVGEPGSNNLNPAGGVNRERDFNLGAYSYLRDPNRTMDDFSIMGDNNGRGRSRGSGWFHPE